MTRQSEDLRQQARRAERLAGSLDERGAKILMELSKEIDAEAERLEQSKFPPPRRY
jgi:hypothetical protein